MCDYPREGLLPDSVLPEFVADAALTKAMSALRLTRLTQNQPARLTAVLGLRRLHKVISEPAVDRKEACRDT